MRRINHFQRFAPVSQSFNQSINRIATSNRAAFTIKPCQHTSVSVLSYSRSFHSTSPFLAEPLGQSNNQTNKQPITQPITPSPVEPVITTDSHVVTPVVKESRLRRLFRQYGAVAVGSYAVIYVGTLGMIYIAVHNRWVGTVDVEHWIEWLGVSTHFENIDTKNGGDFLVAWLATKITEPLRLAITVAITPSVARMLGRAPTKAQNAAAKKAAKDEKTNQESAAAAARADAETKNRTPPSAQ